jgi:hypothetical protein
LGRVLLPLLLLCGCAGALSQAQDQVLGQDTTPVAEGAVIDRVVAVVNSHAILASDIEDEIRLSVLDPGRGGLGVLTRRHALDQLIGRALIEQQIRQEDLQSANPSADEVHARLDEIRKELPACVRGNCITNEGWQNFLAAHGLTLDRVEAYLGYRIEILRFIERRFRQGINISPDEISAYYHDTLLPQYAKGEAIPALAQVSSRIEEILLQQRVNALFDDWFNNLRKQGEIEILDPALEERSDPPLGEQSEPAVPASIAPQGSPSSLNLPPMNVGRGDNRGSR